MCKTIVLKNAWIENETIVPSNLTLAELRYFHRVGVTTEKAWVPTFVFTRGV